MKNQQATLNYRKASLLVAILFISVYASSQNLVLNPSFEDIAACPDNGNQVFKAYPWKSPLNNDADLFNACASSPVIAIPQYFGTFAFYPRTGNGCAALYGSNGPGLNYREYLQDSLSETLTSDVAYAVSFYCFFPSFCKYGLNQLGCHFSNAPFSHTETNASVIHVPTHILNFDEKYLVDTLNWTKISGIYKASGGEGYISIGNFQDDAEDNMLPLSSGWYDGAYYFIDDVSVEEIMQPFWQYRDTTIYYGETVLIGPALTGLDIDWYTDGLDFITNAPGIYVTPLTSRNYIAKETFNGVETEHVVHVTVIGGAGLQESHLQEIHIFPNPGRGSFSISGIESGMSFKLDVHDLHGKSVFEQEYLSKEVNSFDLDLINGIYFVNIIDLVSNKMRMGKLIVNE